MFTNQDMCSLKTDLPVTINLKVNSQYMKITFTISFSAERKAKI